MAVWYYYNEQGDKIEVTGGQLKGLAKAGQITPETIVETEEGKQAPARRVKGLQFAITPTESPTPETTSPTVAPLPEASPFSLPPSPSVESNPFSNLPNPFNNSSNPFDTSSSVPIVQSPFLQPTPMMAPYAVK